MRRPISDVIELLLNLAALLLPLIWLLGVNNFQRGDLLPVFFQPFGANAAQRLNVTGWEGGRDVLLFDVTHTGLNGAGTARIAGKRDGTGTVNADYDADLSPYAAYGIQEGVSGVILEYITPTRAIQTPIIIEKLNFQSAAGSQLKYNFSWKMNVLAGLFVYPAS
jgi:hypothetical protein